MSDVTEGTAPSQFALQIRDDIDQEMVRIHDLYEQTRNDASSLRTIMGALSIDVPSFLEYIASSALPMSDGEFERNFGPVLREEPQPGEGRSTEDGKSLADARREAQAETPTPPVEPPETPTPPVEPPSGNGAPPADDAEQRTYTTRDGRTRRVPTPAPITDIPEHLRELPAAQSGGPLSQRIASAQAQFDLLKAIMSIETDTFVAREAHAAIGGDDVMIYSRVGGYLRDFEKAGFIQRTGTRRHDREKQAKIDAGKWEGQPGKPGDEFRVMVLAVSVANRGKVYEPNAAPQEVPQAEDERTGPNPFRIKSKDARAQAILDAAWKAGWTIERAGDKRLRLVPKEPTGERFLVPLSPSTNDVTLMLSKARRANLISAS